MQNAEGITLRNTGSEPIHAQVRVFSWTQKDNADLLAPTAAVIVSPPILQIAPGSEQLLRVIRSSGASQGPETAYRLIVDELPRQAAPRDSSAPPPSSDAQRSGVTFLMRYSLPVFVGMPQGEAMAPKLDWKLSRAEGASWTLEVHNSGNSRAQIADVQAVMPDASRVTLFKGLLGYVLAGQSMKWSIGAPPAGRTPSGLEAMINRETKSIDAPVP